MKWGLVCKPKVTKSISLAKDVFKLINENGEVFLEKRIADEIETKGYSFKEINEKSDIVITIGGDGTILRTLRYVEKPIFAINSGGMGFLAEVESKYARSAIKQLMEGDYNVEERDKLKIMLDGKRLPDAANEVTVQSSKVAKIMYLKVFIEDELIDKIGADGIIVSTPTGSTSYSLSVGGPLVDPKVKAMIIAPIAPFKLSARPWIVPHYKKVEIKVLPSTKDDTKLVIDGHYTETVTPENEIIVTGSNKKARFVRFGETFYQMVRLKLVR
ncbi:MAG: NAD(+)/NADH kinase [Candidatus Thermoplasmatota archaeon]